MSIAEIELACVCFCRRGDAFSSAGSIVYLVSCLTVTLKLDVFAAGARWLAWLVLRLACVAADVETTRHARARLA